MFFVIIILGDDMEDSKRRKNDIFYLLLLFFTLITMIIGITFTYFSLLTKEEDDSTKVQTGTLAINYIDGIAIDTYALMPINEPNLSILLIKRVFLFLVVVVL